MSNYYVRTNCIICDKSLVDTYFSTDLSIPISCYCKDDNTPDKDIFIPYNIYTCPSCNTSQTKYLGDLNFIYAENHADSTGSIMQNLHKYVCEIIKKHVLNITNITEIGSAKGVLSGLILETFSNISKYYIIEPSFIGDKLDKQIIISDFFENVPQSSYSDSNTLIISHVFEHFYNPIGILNTIKNNKNIENLLLVWPDLEYYKDNGVYHVLNTEHTFYVDNNFIKLLMKNYSFELVEQSKYANHSVIYMFKRNETLDKVELINEIYSMHSYYNNLLDKKEEIINFINNNKNNKKKICIFPASIQTQFLIMLLGLDVNTVDFVLDNSPNKIGKYLYGYNIECKSFEENCSNENNAIILNGGCFNTEVVNKLQISEDQYYIV